MADQSTALVPYEQFRGELVARGDELGSLLPSTITREAFINTAIVAVKATPQLLQCDRRSLHKAVTAAAQDGMKPDGREGAIIPQKEDGQLAARWAPMAYGIRKRAKELDGIVVDTQLVHENDKFVWAQGDDARIEHEPAPLGTDRGKAVGVYAIVRRGTEVLHREVMNEQDIAAVRAISRQANGLMWAKFTGEAWRKTVLRRAMKSVPVSDGLRAVVERDHEEFDLRDITPAPAPAALAKPAVRGPSVLIAWQPGDALEPVPVREFKLRTLSLIDNAEPEAVLAWAERNRMALREFWSLDKDGALAIKAAIEQAAARRQPDPDPGVNGSAGDPVLDEAPPPADQDAQSSMFPEAEAAEPEPDDMELVLRELIAEIGKERDAKKRRAIWEASAKVRASMTDAQVGRLRAAMDQLEMVTGKPARGRQAA